MPRTAHDNIYFENCNMQQTIIWDNQRHLVLIKPHCLESGQTCLINESQNWGQNLRLIFWAETIEYELFITLATEAKSQFLQNRKK